jgi:hypothetical protein
VFCSAKLATPANSTQAGSFKKKITSFILNHTGIQELILLFGSALEKKIIEDVYFSAERDLSLAIRQLSSISGIKPPVLSDVSQ